MRRREFMTLIGSATAAARSGLARAQEKTPRVGVLWHGANGKDEAIYLGAVQQGLGDFGYVDGRNIILVHRFAAEIPERFARLAAELAARSQPGAPRRKHHRVVQLCARSHDETR
jgi:putative tryptophan/tyrosine transport system substrate-binding protein